VNDKAYNLKILSRAAKALKDLPPDTFEKINDAIVKLRIHPYPHGTKKLAGREGWRLRIGRYRVIYSVDSKKRTVVVLDIGQRKDIYKN